MKILLLNGPPRCGKDTLANFFHALTGAYRMKFSRILKERTHALYGLDVPFDHFEDTKDEPNALFFGLTPRAAYIAVSEVYFKTVHGKDIFGKLFVKSLEQLNPQPELVVVSDCGFEEELVPLIERYGKENCLGVNIYRDGCDFSNDSRSYVDFVKLLGSRAEIENNGYLGELYDAADVMMHLMGSKPERLKLSPRFAT